MSRSHQLHGVQDATELAGIVREANEHAERLLAVLIEERDALSSSDVARIDSCGQRKADCIARLEILESERVKMCRVLAVADADIEDFLVLNGIGTARQIWPRLLANLEQCREANAVNGTVTRLRRRHIERALQVLRGGANDGPALYGPNGLDNIKEVSSLGKA